MHFVAVSLSVLLAALFAVTGIMKVLDSATARSNAEHLGISPRLSHLIGLAEIAAAVGLLAGIAVKPLTVVTAAAVCLLMVGALGSHFKARDKAAAALPAAITGLAAVALLPLALAA